MSLAGGSGASDHTQSHEDQQAQPERLTVQLQGFALLESMRQAVRAGRMSAKEAAACLLAFLSAA